MSFDVVVVGGNLGDVVVVVCDECFLRYDDCFVFCVDGELYVG